MNETGNPWMRRLFIASAVLLSIFIVVILLMIVLHPSPGVLVRSVLSDEIIFAIWLSVATSVISTLLCIFVAVPASYALARYSFSGKNIINTILDMPLALPPIVAGVGLLLFFSQTPVGKGLAAVGIEFVFTPLGIIVAQFFVNLPFMVRIMRSTFISINPRYENVARTLGCSGFQALWRVTFPMAKEGFLAGTVITWARGMGEFGAALMVAGATKMKTESLPVAVFLNMSTGNLDVATSAAAILIAIAVFSLYVFERFGGSSKL